MQVRVTIDVDPTDRIIIGAANEGTFRNATREELQNFITDAYDTALNEPRKAYQAMVGSTVAAIKDALGL